MFLLFLSGRVPLIVVTHADSIDNDDCIPILEALQDLFVTTKDRIFFVENITSGKRQVQEYTKLSVLNLLCHCITESDSATKRHEIRDAERQTTAMYNVQLEAEQDEKLSKYRVRKLQDMKTDFEVEKITKDRDHIKKEEERMRLEKIRSEERIRREEKKREAARAREEKLADAKIEAEMLELEQRKEQLKRDVQQQKEKQTLELLQMEDKYAREVMLMEEKAKKETSKKGRDDTT